MKYMLSVVVAVSLLVSCKNSVDTKESCGDGIIDVGEECDGQALGGATCQGAGYYGGNPFCTEGCTVDMSECQAAGWCGDGVIQGDQGEHCDGENLGGATCTTEVGTYGGELQCDQSCQLVTTGCFGVCGDGILDGDHEMCDGAAKPGCFESGSGFFGETVCSEACELDLSDCRTTEIWGGQSDDQGTDMARDSEGNIYVTGYINGEDIFVRKYFRGGGMAWDITTGTPSDDRAFGITVTGDDRVIVTGYTSNSLNGQTHYGGRDLFLLAFTTDGTPLFTTQWGSDAEEVGLAVTTNSLGSIFVAGLEGASELFVARFSAQGVYEAHDMDLHEHYYEDFVDVDIAVDSGDAIYTLANSYDYEGTIDDYPHIRLYKHDAALVRQGVLLFHDTAKIIGGSLYMSPDDSLYFTGQSSVTLGDQGYGATDIILGKLLPDFSGTEWIAQFGSSTGDLGVGVTGDASGFLYVTGATYGPLGAQDYVWGFDIFVTKFSPLGVPLATTLVGSSYDEVISHTRGNEIGFAVEVLSSSDIIVLGRGDGSLGREELVGDNTGQNIIMVHIPPM